MKKMIKSITYIGILLLINHDACKAVLVIATKNEALLNHEFFFGCLMRVKYHEVDNLNTMPFQFIAPDQACNVTNWKACDVHFPANPVDGQCSCISRTLERSFRYNFLFYRSRMTEVPQDTFYYCKLDKHSIDGRRLSVNGFTQTPGPVSTAYEGTDLTLSWVFPMTNYFKYAFTLREVTWKLQDTEIGNCITELRSSEGNTFNKSVVFICSVKSDSEWEVINTQYDNIPKLVLYNVTKKVSSSILSISLSFYDNDDFITFKGESMATTSSTASGSNTTTVPFYTSMSAEPYTGVVNLLESSTATTEVENKETTAGTTIALPLEINVGLYVKKQIYVVTDSTRIEVIDIQQQSCAEVSDVSTCNIIMTWTAFLIVEHILNTH